MADGTTFPAELASIDFHDILGGPMCAAVAAQAQSAMVTMNFIEQVGFTQAQAGQPKTVSTVDFDYTQTFTDEQGNQTPTQQSLSVPILSIVPIPYLRVQQLSVDLNVKLHSVQSQDCTNTVTKNFQTSSSSNFLAKLFSPVNFSGSITDQSVSKASSQVDRQYSLEVKMLAVQDQVPGGMSKVLDIFEEVIEAEAKGNQPHQPHQPQHQPAQGT